MHGPVESDGIEQSIAMIEKWEVMYSKFPSEYITYSKIQFHIRKHQLERSYASTTYHHVCLCVDTVHNLFKTIAWMTHQKALKAS